MLYQLSYTPKKQILSFIELPYEHRDTALETVALPAELYPYIKLLKLSNPLKIVGFLAIKGNAGSGFGDRHVTITSYP